jgi:chemotaxis protein methyltransferase CheR
MDHSVFTRFCDLAYDKAGIYLREGKEALVATRVSKRMRSLGLASERSYLEYLEKDDTGDELVAFLDAVTTNYTFFFREPEHFDIQAQLMRRWATMGTQKFRIWCAASSTGEEPYAIAITAREALGGNPDLRILATDLSTRVLATARGGIYGADRLEKATPEVVRKYFDKAPPGPRGEPLFSVRAEVREHLLFKRLNLAKPPFPMSGPFDLVFCRNVMMYFDLPVRQRLVDDIERMMGPESVLFIGRSETLGGLKTRLVPLAAATYCWPSNPMLGGGRMGAA